MSQAIMMKFLVVASMMYSCTALAVESICYGTVSKGRLEGGVKLPTNGANFSAYSSLGTGSGRTYAHNTVQGIVVAAYKALEQSAPGKTFVYGETGWESGGRFRPHRTHQNGLSVDFMVPVFDKNNQSVPLPTSPLNKFGYDIEFDVNAKYEGYTIDFEAMAEHLYQLYAAAKARDVKMALVIFDPPFLQRLFATERGPFIKQNLNFMKRQAWVRHDEHYHIDFAIPCKPMQANPVLQRGAATGSR